MKIKLSIKDYIFLAIVAVGMIFLAVQNITTKNDDVLQENIERARVTIGKSVLNVYVADTEEERYLGLSGLENIEFDQGALFVHEAPGRYAYSMREMRFDLDFIFILEDRIVDMARNIAYEYQGEIAGAVDYDKVLEVNAEWIRHNNVKIGDYVKIE